MSEPEEPDRPPEGAGRVRTTRPGAVAAFAVVGLLGGRLLRPVTLHLSGTSPTVGWLPVGALAFVAVVVAAVAWSTYRALHRRHERLEPHHAVNRLVLAKSCALAGALVAGGYAGYALSLLGLTDAEQGQRLLPSLVGAVSGVALVVGSLLLERACRVSRDQR